MNVLTAALAVDGGKSGIRVTARAGEESWYGEGRGTFDGSGVDGIAAVTASVVEAVEASGFRGRFSGVYGGLTTLPHDAKRRRELRDALSNAFDTQRVVLVDDVVTAHIGALNGPGTVVSAGTGACVLSVRDDGAAARGDGWGPVMGDRGSGYDVGQAGLRAGWSAIDGAGPETILSAALASFLGGVTLAQAQAFYTAAGLYARVSAFAPEVFAAARSGDHVAESIVREAACRLAATVGSVSGRIRSTSEPVSFSGRLFLAGQVLLDPLAEALKDRGFNLRRPGGGSLDGALRLAGNRCNSLYRPLIATYQTAEASVVAW